MKNGEFMRFFLRLMGFFFWVLEFWSFFDAILMIKIAFLPEFDGESVGISLERWEKDGFYRP